MREHPSMFCGLWVLTGLLVFIIVEKLFTKENPEILAEEVKLKEKEAVKNNNNLKTTPDDDCKGKEVILCLLVYLLCNLYVNKTLGS